MDAYRTNCLLIFHEFLEVELKTKDLSGKNHGKWMIKQDKEVLKHGLLISFIGFFLQHLGD